MSDRGNGADLAGLRLGAVDPAQSYVVQGEQAELRVDAGLQVEIARHSVDEEGEGKGVGQDGRQDCGDGGERQPDGAEGEDEKGEQGGGKQQQDVSLPAGEGVVALPTRDAQCLVGGKGIWAERVRLKGLGCVRHHVRRLPSPMVDWSLCRVLRDVIPPTPPGPEGSNGNGPVWAQ